MAMTTGAKMAPALVVVKMILKCFERDRLIEKVNQAFLSIAEAEQYHRDHFPHAWGWIENQENEKIADIREIDPT